MEIAKELPDQDTLRRLFDYCPASGKLIWRYNPSKTMQVNGRMAGKYAGSIDKKGYVRVHLNGKQYPAHRIIWKLAYGEIPTDLMIDHIDGDPKNNRLDNLRLCTNSQNQFNRGNTSKKDRPKGVYKARGKFKAEITINKQRIYLGSFPTVEQAEQRYNEFAADHHGEFIH